MTIRQSHQWEEFDSVEARCPYCGRWHIYQHIGDAGDIVNCDYCGKKFKLGVRGI